MQRAAEALRQQDVEAAGKAIQEADALLEKHPDDLGRLAARYLSLKQTLDSMQRRIAGAQDIRDLFQQAGQRRTALQPAAAVSKGGRDTLPRLVGGSDDAA